VDGRHQSDYTDVFELMCPDCGDCPDLEYAEVAPRLQWLRGPRPLEAGLAAFHKHLGLAWMRTEPEVTGPGHAKAPAVAESTEVGLS